MSTQSLEFKQQIKATPAQVYHAFTNATALREWLCDVATLVPQVGGRVYLAWNSGYYTCGEYTSLEKDKEVAFTWLGRNDPGMTRVQATFSAKNGGTQVLLKHELIRDSDEWTQAIQDIKQGWEKGLENLASVLHTGEDLRLTLRPMLGIFVGDFTPEQAKSLGVPVTDGLRIDDTVEGLGARAAGLQHNDVLVGMAGKDIGGNSDLGNVLQGQRAGDQVEVVIYRGPQKMTLNLELSRRPIPEIPATNSELARKIGELYTGLEEEIDKFFGMVSDSEASFKVAPHEWSAKEVLAHLIHGERFLQLNLAEVVGGYERRADDFGGNLDASVQATVSVYPTLQEILDEYKHCCAETVALFANLPQEFEQRKGSYWRTAYGVLEAPYHFNIHIEQMRASIEAARSA
jgi:uncharacterized protein YndB with AHSA1/START domain